MKTFEWDLQICKCPTSCGIAHILILTVVHSGSLWWKTLSTRFRFVLNDNGLLSSCFFSQLWTRPSAIDTSAGTANYMSHSRSQTIYVRPPNSPHSTTETNNVVIRSLLIIIFGDHQPVNSRWLAAKWLKTLCDSSTVWSNQADQTSFQESGQIIQECVTVMALCWKHSLWSWCHFKPKIMGFFLKSLQRAPKACRRSVCLPPTYTIVPFIP